MIHLAQASKKIWINATKTSVWHALTIPAERNKWETKQCEIDLRLGGTIFLDYGWGVTYRGEIKHFVLHEKLVTADENGDTTSWTIVPEDNGCLVTIEYSGQWSGDSGLAELENMLFGTYQFMKNLKSVMENSGDERSGFWRSWIGSINCTDSQGVKVVNVVAGTPAEGLFVEGDYLQMLNGHAVEDYDQFESAITLAEAGSHFTVVVRRGNHFLDIPLKTIPFGTTLTK